MSFLDDLLEDLSSSVSSGLGNTGGSLANGLINDLLDSFGLGMANLGGSGEGTQASREYLDYLRAMPFQNVGATNVNPTAWNPTNLDLAGLPQVGYNPVPFQTVGALPQATGGGYAATLANAAQLDRSQLERILAEGYSPTSSSAAQIDLDKLKQAVTQGYTPAKADLVNIGPMSQVDLKGYEASLLGDPEKVTEDAALLAQQRGLSQGIQGRIDAGGFDATDQGIHNRILGDQSRQATRQNQAVLDDLSTRGLLGSGSEIASRMAANQSAAEAGNVAGLNLAKQGRDRVDALSQLQSGLLGNIRDADARTATTNADAINNFNLQNSQFKNAASQFGADAANRGALANQQANNTATIQQASNANRNNEWNAGAQNDASQFGAAAANQAAGNFASQYNSALNNNANLQQESNIANQNAANTAAQWSAGQRNQAAATNAGATNDALMQNLANQQAVNLSNQTATNSANQWSQGQANDASRFNTNLEWNRQAGNADSFNANAELNARLGQSAQTTNQDAWLRAALANLGYNNDSGKFNANQSTATSLANADNQIDATKANNTNLNNQATLMGSGYEKYIKQLNAEEAARAKQAYSNDLLSQLGGLAGVGVGAGAGAAAGGDWLADMFGDLFGGYDTSGNEIIWDDWLGGFGGGGASNAADGGSWLSDLFGGSGSGGGDSSWLSDWFGSGSGYDTEYDLGGTTDWFNQDYSVGDDDSFWDTALDVGMDWIGDWAGDFLTSWW